MAKKGKGGENVSNGELARIFREIAVFYEMENDSFRARAYEEGAEIIDTLAESATDIYKKGGEKAFEKLPGVGKGMAEKIEEFVRTSRIKKYEELKKKIPVDVSGLMAVEGLGPKKIKSLYQKLEVKNISDLQRAAKRGKIRNLPNFGEKTETNILEGIAFVQKSGGRVPLGYVIDRVERLIKEIEKLPGVSKVAAAGSYRRRKETVGDIDLLVVAKKTKVVTDFLTALLDVAKVWGKGGTKASVHLSAGFDIDVRIVRPESFGAALQYFTGSKQHNIRLRRIAIGKGYKLNEYGLFKGSKSIAGKTEEEVYKKLELEAPPPEIREDAGELEILASGKPLPKLVEYGSLRGDLQVQTNWTDGAANIEDMARAAIEVGLEYIAITDHTKALAMTGGLDEKRLREQMKEIDKLNKRFEGEGIRFRILKGSEVDILKDGMLDLPDSVLTELDIVGASVHSHFKLSRKEQTERIIRAINNPNVDILLHPTGRLINKRAPYEVDMERIILEAVRTGTILEIDAYPDRLDLKDEHIRIGVEKGARFVIDSDAHQPSHFKWLGLGIAQARRGWATQKHILNTLPMEEFLKELKK